MKMKKLALVIMSLILAAPVMATTVKTKMIVESNAYDDSSKGAKEDYVGLGLGVSQPLTEKTSLSISTISYDYYNFGDGRNIDKKAKTETTIFLNNKILKMENGLNVALNLGTRRTDEVTASKATIDYRVQPKFTYPIGEDIQLSGSYLFYEQKDSSNFWYRHELETGVTYTGIDNYKLYAGLYDEKKSSIMTDDDTDSHYMQLRAKVSTKLAGVSVTPWVRLQLAETDKKDSKGDDAKNGEKINRYGVDLSKKINDVSYATQLYTQTYKYDDSKKDATRTYVEISATYSF